MAFIGQEPVNTFSQVPTKDSFTGDGSTTTFDLSNAVVSSGENALEVFVNNVRQEPGSGKAFTLGVDGSNELKRITFSAAPANGASIYVINDKTSFTQGITPTDLGGVELILDADGDTSLTADTDDRIDFKIAGVEHIALSNSSGDTVIKPMVDAKDIIFQQYDGNKVLEINDGGFVGIGGNSNAAGEIRIFEDTDNGSNYVGLSVGNVSTSYTLVFPNADGSSGQAMVTNGSGVLTFTDVSSAADDITAGDAAINLTTTSGNITIDAQGNDTDIIFKGTDGSADTTFLTLDGSDAGTAIFNHDIKIADDGQIGSASAADAMIISSGGIVTFKDDIVIKDGGTIGSASDADSITIASNGVVTFSQAPVFPDGSIAVADLDIDGATDIGADLVDADLFIVDDGAGGTNRKVAASRIKTYIGGGTQWQAVKTGNYTASAGEGVFMNITSSALTLTLPAGSIGDEVTFVDYAGTFDTNNLTIAANGSEKIHGSTDDLTVAVERAANTLVFTDSTQGWLLKSK